MTHTQIRRLADAFRNGWDRQASTYPGDATETYYGLDSVMEMQRDALALAITKENQRSEFLRHATPSDVDDRNPATREPSDD